MNLKELCDRYITLRFFGYRLAVRAMREANQHKLEFWKKFKKLYPETELLTTFSYNKEKGTVTVDLKINSA